MSSIASAKPSISSRRASAVVKLMLARLVVWPELLVVDDCAAHSRYKVPQSRERALARLVAQQQRGHLVRRQRAAEVEALAQRAALRDQETELLLGLDALGDDLAAERLGELDDRLDHRGRLVGLGDLAHE